MHGIRRSPSSLYATCLPVLDLPQPQGSPVTAQTVAVGPFSVVESASGPMSPRLSAFKLGQGLKPVTPAILSSLSKDRRATSMAPGPQKEDMYIEYKNTPCEHFTLNQLEG
jgi:hypothetical protein